MRTEQVLTGRPAAEGGPCFRGPQTGDHDRREIACRMPAHRDQMLYYKRFI